MRIRLAVIATALGLAAGAAAAHHSFAVFNMQTEVSITGVVKEVQWTNPHIFIWVDVTGENGEVVTWGLEGMSPNFLARRGWTRTTLEPGDEVTVSLRPLVNGDPGGMFMSTTTPDGVVLSMGGGREGGGGQ
jgi:Family of unknown function (DUF6152)